MDEKNIPSNVWSQYQKGVDYLSRNDIYNIVKINEDFYDGRQWVGCDTKNMPQPVFNVLQRAGKFMVATIGSNDVAVSMIPFSSLPEDIKKMEPIKDEVERIIEQAKIKESAKLVIRNAFVDGSGYMMQTFNPNFDTMQEIKGRVENQIVDNTCIYFGNPYSRDIQTQPYIIVSLRQHISQVMNEARKNGVSEEEIEQIFAENDSLQPNDDSDNLVTVLIKYYRDDETNTIWFTKCTKDVTIIEPTDLKYKRYPISCFGWDVKKNSYLYNSPMTSVISNQVFINKCFAIAQMYGLQSAFPKVVFDKSKIDIDRFLNETNPTAVAGIDLAGKFVDFIKIPDFSNNIIQLGQETIAQTKDCLGVTDASLGNVRPDNTSAIIALQEASSVPLEIQKQQFFEMWEDTVRNILDIVSCSYGTRMVMTSDNQLAKVDFSMLRGLNYNLSVEIGNSAQFSEIAQINTIDKLRQGGLIDDDVYADIIPTKYIPQKARVVQNIKDRMARMAQMGTVPESRGSIPQDNFVPISGQ